MAANAASRWRAARASSRRPSAPPRASKVNLAIRPEKVALGAAAAAASIAFPAKVLEVSFLGDQLRVRLAALGREDFIVKLANAPGQAALEPGGTVEIGWRAEDCRALAVSADRAHAAYWLIVLPAVLMLVVLYFVPLGRRAADQRHRSQARPRQLRACSSPAPRCKGRCSRRCASPPSRPCFALLLGYVVAYAMRAASTRTAAAHAGLRAAAVLDLGAGALLRLDRAARQRRVRSIRQLVAWGLIDEPLALVRNETGVLIGMVHIMLPYAILTLYANMRGIDVGLVAAARSLGASRASRPSAWCSCRSPGPA